MISTVSAQIPKIIFAVMAAAICLLALYPQIDLNLRRGSAWQGAFAYIDTDETAYAAYVNALIDGRPRRNDPYTGKDGLPGVSQSESLFSIQFVPAYLVAVPARVFGLSSSASFILVMVLGALLTAVCCYMFFFEVTGDSYFSSAGTAAVLCLATLAAGQGAIRVMLGVNAAYHNLPFLRRYIPLLAFPFFFMFLLSVMRVLRNRSNGSNLLWTVIGLASFSVVIFSYFFLWTAALGWMACLFFVLLITKPEAWLTSMKWLVGLGAGIGIVLVPYFVLLSHRPPTMDAAQLLQRTHLPELDRVPELIGLVSLALFIALARRKKISLSSPVSICAITCCLAPLLLFNQQIITGRSLQPIHYEQFIANYVCVAGVLLCFFALSNRSLPDGRRFRISTLLLIGLGSLLWGFNETNLAVEIYRPFNLARDEGWAVSNRLKAIQNEVDSGLNGTPLVLSTVDIIADDLPSATSMGVLWARHMHVFSGVDLAENKHRFYDLLYYTGVSPDEIKHGLTEKEFYYTVALFGWDRANFNLTSTPSPLSEDEIAAEVERYESFVEHFDQNEARAIPLSFLVTQTGDGTKMENFDKWYVRDEGENIGDYKLYRVKLR